MDEAPIPLTDALLKARGETGKETAKEAVETTKNPVESKGPVEKESEEKEPTEKGPVEKSNEANP